MDFLEQHKKQNKDRAIKCAITSWTDKKNGIYRWFEKKKYTTDYCEKQIQFFKNLKL